MLYSICECVWNASWNTEIRVRTADFNAARDGNVRKRNAIITQFKKAASAKYKQRLNAHISWNDRHFDIKWKRYASGPSE
jgi:hypothetical protein